MPGMSVWRPWRPFSYAPGDRPFHLMPRSTPRLSIWLTNFLFSGLIDCRNLAEELYSFLYPSGPGIFFSISAARAIISASVNVPFIHLEDVYVTALVYRQHLNGTLTDLSGAIRNPNQPIDACHFFKNCIFKMTGNKKKFRDFWKSVQDAKYSADCIWLLAAMRLKRIRRRCRIILLALSNFTLTCKLMNKQGSMGSSLSLNIKNNLSSSWYYSKDIV